MDNKVMAVIIVAILAVASVSVFAIAKTSGNDDDPEKTACGTWYATFNEYVVFDDNVADIEVINHHFYMSDEKIPLVVNSIDNGLIEGQWNGVPFVGAIHNHFFIFSADKYPFAKEDYSCSVEGRMIEDRIMLNISIYGDQEETIAGAGYVQYTRQGTIPTDLYIDKLAFPTEYIPESRGVYNVSDGAIQEVLPGKATPAMEHIASGVMLHVVKVDLPHDSVKENILVFGSQGHDREGCGLAYITGRLSFEGNVHYYAGGATLSNGTLAFSYELDLENVNQYVGTFTYKVDYAKGEASKVNIGVGDMESTVHFTKDGKTEKKDCTVTIKALNNCMTMVIKDSDGKVLLSFIGALLWHNIHGASLLDDYGYYLGYYREGTLSIIGEYETGDVNTVFQFELEFEQ